MCQRFNFACLPAILSLFLSAPPVSAGAPARAEPWLSIEPSTDRLGADYRVFDLPVADVEPCRRACAEDSKCAAYTYADAGLVSEMPRCFLKSSAPGKSYKAGCTSGAKSTVSVAPMPASPLSMEPMMDRPGADYVSFDLPTPDVKSCRSACFADVRCAAYTYAEPGLVSPQARCFLKSNAPPAIPKAGCTSGARFSLPALVR